MNSKTSLHSAHWPTYEKKSTKQTFDKLKDPLRSSCKSSLWKRFEMSPAIVQVMKSDSFTRWLKLAGKKKPYWEITHIIFPTGLRHVLKYGECQACKKGTKNNHNSRDLEEKNITGSNETRNGSRGLRGISNINSRLSPNRIENGIGMGNGSTGQVSGNIDTYHTQWKIIKQYCSLGCWRLKIH